jgi:hypothetical protein
MLDLRGLPHTFWILWTGALVNRLGGFVLPLAAQFELDERRLTRCGTSCHTADV